MARRPYEPPPERPKKIMIRLADGKERTIQRMMATSYWGPDGKPMSADQFSRSSLANCREFFKDEDELRKLWSQPDTRKALLEAWRKKASAATSSPKSAG